jgi:hypothetical protein
VRQRQIFNLGLVARCIEAADEGDCQGLVAYDNLCFPKRETGTLSWLTTRFPQVRLRNAVQKPEYPTPREDFEYHSIGRHRLDDLQATTNLHLTAELRPDFRSINGMRFPFLMLLVSGGHALLVLVTDSPPPPHSSRQRRTRASGARTTKSRGFYSFGVGGVSRTYHGCDYHSLHDPTHTVAIPTAMSTTPSAAADHLHKTGSQACH